MQKIVYWEMENGHQHSFITEEDDWTEDTNVPDAGWDGTTIKNQGEYYDFVCSSEGTSGKIEDEYAYPEELERAIDVGAVYYDCDGTIMFI